MWLGGVRGRVWCGWVLCSGDYADGPAVGLLCCFCLVQDGSVPTVSAMASVYISLSVFMVVGCSHVCSIA
jgi:hypothetical protein